MFRVIVRLTANDTESVIATRIEKLSSTVMMFTLSPGDPGFAEARRAGVKASVNTNFTKNVEEPIIEISR
jgi:hypothetical protein